MWAYVGQKARRTGHIEVLRCLSGFFDASCPKTFRWAVICRRHIAWQKNGLQPDIQSLLLEKPDKLMAQLRAVWPPGTAPGLDAGHTLRRIHKRLNAVGIPISYKRLTVYRGRLRREKGGPEPAPLLLRRFRR